MTIIDPEMGISLGAELTVEQFEEARIERLVLCEALYKQLQAARAVHERSFEYKLKKVVDSVGDMFGSEISREEKLSCVVLGEGVDMPRSLASYHMAEIALPLCVDDSDRQFEEMQHMLERVHVKYPIYRFGATLGRHDPVPSEGIDSPFYTFDALYTAGASTAELPSPSRVGSAVRLTSSPTAALLQ